MISVVYFKGEGGRNIMVAAFLLKSDAEQFIKGTFCVDDYKIKDVEDWKSWSKIAGSI